ncbi:MAG: hypothetical protein REI11_07200, partial [Patulibacter sp.]|nr:hypothetical protein [Patulibacter sp.]
KTNFTNAFDGNVDKIAYAMREYDFESTDGAVKSFERVYGFWEDQLPGLLEALSHEYILNEDDWHSLTEFAFDLHTRNPVWRRAWEAGVGAQTKTASAPVVRGTNALLAGGHWASVAREIQTAEFVRAPEAYPFVLSDVPMGIYSSAAPLERVLLVPGPYPDDSGKVPRPMSPTDVRNNPFLAELALTPRLALRFRPRTEGEGRRSFVDAHPGEVDEMNRRALWRALKIVVSHDRARLEDLRDVRQETPHPFGPG